MSPTPEVRIGERLRFYRQAKGKTQAVVAGLAGVTEDYLSQIERGLKTPTHCTEGLALQPVGPTARASRANRPEKPGQDGRGLHVWL
jgi:transcriptional regulator with XRE-family HTH domain